MGRFLTSGFVRTRHIPFLSCINNYFFSFLNSIRWTDVLFFVGPSVSYHRSIFFTQHTILMQYLHPEVSSLYITRTPQEQSRYKKTFITWFHLYKNMLRDFPISSDHYHLLIFHVCNYKQLNFSGGEREMFLPVVRIISLNSTRNSINYFYIGALNYAWYLAFQWFGRSAIGRHTPSHEGHERLKEGSAGKLMN